ncbi:MAG: hypothetical protein HRT61_25030 [Ekhidna sp.]|nr:hypothetical protein [Ekhidna sp.]
MTIDELLTEHRNYYVNQFTEFQKNFPDGAAELLLELKTDEPEEIYRLYRYDLIQHENGEDKISEFNVDGFLNHQEIVFTIGNKSLVVNPLVWNGVEISCNNTSVDFKPIVEWAHRWIDESEQTNERLAEKIHNITKPSIESDWLTTSVDFGTAPVKALIELLEILLSDELTTSVRIESKWMTQEN